MTINSSRLQQQLAQLAEIGAYRDPETGLMGVCRLALSAEDGRARRQLMAWMEEVNLMVSVDPIGNIFGRRPGRQEQLAPVMLGSHIDTVPTAGHFDGCLGVLGGLEILRRLEETSQTTLRPLVLAAFSEEEGCRFGTDMLGSAVACGRIPLEQAYGLRDRQGLEVGQQLRELGFQGQAPWLWQGPAPHAYLECHIEQGPLLAEWGCQIGVVTGVQAISWQALSLVGRAAHAGATPMHLRADAGVAAARINLYLRQLIASGRFGQMRATMGSIIPQPGLINIVPGRVEATLDLRNPDDEALARAEAELLSFYATLQAEEGVEVRWRQTARTPAVTFDLALQQRIAAVAEAQGLSWRPLVAGAGHDAQELTRLCPSAMIFVPGLHDGISHNPREYSTPQQCAAGIDVLAEVLLQLAEEEDDG